MADRFFAMKKVGDVGPAKKLTSLLSGPPSCGKTSLLFQYALNCASERNGEVVFICNRRRLEMKPPFLSQEIEPSSDLHQRIQMKYIEDDDCLKKYFAAFHFHEIFPSAVIIDDFGDFFSNRNCHGNTRGRDLAMVRTLALCCDAMIHANEKLESTESCELLISDTHQGDNPRLLFLYKRWIQCIFTIQEKQASKIQKIHNSPTEASPGSSAPGGDRDHIRSASGGVDRRLQIKKFKEKKQPFLATVCLLSRFIPREHEAGVHSNGLGSFLLKSITAAGGTTEKASTAKYSIALQYLVLEEITDEE